MWDWVRTKLAERAWAQGESLRRNRRLRQARAKLEAAVRRAGSAAARRPAARKVVTGARLGLGRIHLASSAPRRAVRELEIARSLQPEAWEPAYWQGCALGWMGDFPAAETALSDALELSGDQAFIRVQRGYARLKAGRLEKAFEDLATAASHDVLDARGRLALASLFMRRKEWDEAEELLRSVARTPGIPPEVHLMLGEVAEEQDHRHEAVRAYQKAARCPEVAALAWTRLGALNAKSNDPERAFECLEKAMDLGPKDDSTLFLHGWVAYELGHFERCVRSWSELHERRPRRRQLELAVNRARYAWGCELLRRGEPEQAVPLWEAYCEDRELDQERLRALAELYLRVVSERLSRNETVDTEQIRQLLEKGWQRVPGDARFPYHLGLAEAAEGRPEAALPLLRKAAELDPAEQRTRFFLAFCTAMAGDAPGARRERERWDRPGAETFGSERLDIALAALEIRQGCWSEAADCLRTADRPATEAQALLAMSLFRAGRFIELASLEDPAPQVRYWQAGLHARDGRWDEALAVLRALAEEHPDYVPARVAIGRILLLQTAMAEARRADWVAAGATVSAAQTAAGTAVVAPVLEALLLLLAGRREEAVGVLEEAHRRSPAEGDIVHALAVACFHTARSRAAPAGSVEDWHRAIASWVSIQHQDDFWQKWQTETCARYRLDPSDPAVAAPARPLQEQLNALLEASVADNGTSSGLAAALRREQKAAEMLAEVGGLPVPGTGGARLRCGPLMVRLLGLDQTFGRFAAALPERVERPQQSMKTLLEILAGRPAPAAASSPPSALEPERKKRLLRYFSDLGMAQALLDLERPQEALTALSAVGCSRCRSRGTDGRPPVCASTCPCFDALNPGYVGQQDKGRALAEDAAALMVEAHLGIGQRSTTSSDMDLAAARSSWRQALRLADELGRRPETEDRIVETVLGRLSVFRPKKRLDEAVALLESSVEVCGETGRPRLIAQLAEVLTDRGVNAGNARPPRWQDAAGDLRRAVDYSPHAPRPLVNLSIALQSWAAENYRQGRPDTALNLQEEAVRRLQERRSNFPGQHEVETQHRQAQQNFHALVNGRAMELTRSGQFEGALAVLDRGLRLLPGDRLLKGHRQGVLTGYLAHLLQAGRHREMVEVMSRHNNALRQRRL